MTLKVLQWNCMYSEDIEAVAEFVGVLKPDIVFLQELTNNYHESHLNTSAYVARVLGYAHYSAYGPMVLPDGTQAEMGMGIFSRFPLLDKQKIILQEGLVEDGKILRDERFFLQAAIEYDGKEVGVCTTHLPFHPRFRTTPHKQRMVDTILDASRGYDQYIFAADLNTTPGTKAAATFRKHGLRNAGPALTLPTWTTKPFSIGPWHYEALRWRLDYVLTKGVTAQRAQIVETHLSDHLPISVEIVV
jgi:endonuclease/exonuclease/phosphatase family metal-dependent hydrolase